MSKEIGKLLKLLNEYEKENKSDLYYKFELENGELYCYNDVSDVLWTMQDEAMVICSKKYGFIEWLVRNDHIDFKKLDTPRFNQLVYNTLDSYLALLMLLAVQDEPIKFLTSILK